MDGDDSFDKGGWDGDWNYKGECQDVGGWGGNQSVFYVCLQQGDIRQIDQSNKQKSCN